MGVLPTSPEAYEGGAGDPVLEDLVVRAVAALTAGDKVPYLDAVGELGRCQPKQSSTVGSPAVGPFVWSTLVLTAMCRSTLDYCYANTWSDTDGVNELAGSIGDPPNCDGRSIVGFLTAMASGARGKTPPEGAITDPQTATHAALAVLAWLRSEHTPNDQS